MENVRETSKAPCPDCRLWTLRPSRPRKFKDRLMRLVGKYPMRCQTCGKRFYVSAKEQILEASDS